MYLVIELQTTAGQTANIVTAYTDRNTAEQAYHSILASAAVSSVDVHTAIMVDEYGISLKREFYDHREVD